jgi:ABC-type glycerol-3-phosphate transport system substrate-binding protein
VTSNHLLKRRHFLAWCTSLTLGTATGCSDSPGTTPAETTTRRDIPLKVAIALDGNPTDTDSRVNAIQRAWSAVSGQPLAIEAIDYDRAQSPELADRALSAAKNCDVLVYPIALGSELATAEAIAALSDEFVKDTDREYGSLLPALRNGLSVYADQTIGLPLGTSLPAILSIDAVKPIESWDDYDEWVAQDCKDQAAEPTAPGWAATMFLWRAASIKEWLFDRETLDPLIDTAPYIETLERFVGTHDRYQMKRQRPEQIWSGIVSGTLNGGISWQHKGTADVEVNVADLPGSSNPGRVLFDPFTQIASLSANCRQSEAAKRFVAWITGAESSQAMRREVFVAAANRDASDRQTQLPSLSARESSYDRWLANQLARPLTRPTLQLANSMEYYSALDRAIGLALDHTASAPEALGQVSKRWRQITEDVGAKKQLRIWNRLQGLSG